MDLLDLWLSKQWVQSLVFGALGGFGAWMLAQLPTRSRVLQCWVTHTPVGFSGWKLSGTAPEIKVTLGGTEVHAVYRTVVTVANTTLRDLSNVTVAISTTNDALIGASEQRVQGNGSAIALSPTFREKTAVADGAQPTEQQKAYAFRNREFLIPLLSRGGSMEVELVTIPKGDTRPEMAVQIPMEGVRVAWINDSSRVWGVLRPVALRWGHLLGFLFLLGFGLATSQWLGPVVAFFLGLLVIPAGAFASRAFNRVLVFLFR